MPALVNPHLAQRRLRWRNRVDGWRAAPAEPLFQLLATLLLLALAGLLLDRLLASAAAPLVAAWQAHPWSIAGAVAVLGFIDSRRRLALQRRQWQRGWLAAQPIPPSLQRQALAARLLRRWAIAMLLLAVLSLLVARATSLPLTLPVSLIAALAAGATIAWLADRPNGPMRLASTGAATADTLGGRGRLWRWQLLAMFAARRGAALAPGLWLLMALPMGRYDLVLLLAILLSALLLAAFAAAWRLALATMVAAAAWLAPQPWPPVAWLRAAVPLPLGLLGLLLLMLAPALWAAGGAAAVLLIAALVAGALLQLLTTLAERRHPRRIRPLLVLHFSLLAGVAAGLPPLVPVLLMLQLGWLLRRILRSP